MALCCHSSSGGLEVLNLHAHLNIHAHPTACMIFCNSSAILVHLQKVTLSHASRPGHVHAALLYCMPLLNLYVHAAKGNFQAQYRAQHAVLCLAGRTAPSHRMRFKQDFLLEFLMLEACVTL